MMTDQTVQIVPVILCGGSGTRLWPLSREEKPKQFLKLIGDHSFIQETALRALRTCGAKPENIVVVTLAAMADLVKQQLGDLDPAMTKHVLCEPVARNTAAAVAMAAVYVQEKFGSSALMWVLPADHHIADESALKTALDDAITSAKDNYLVTFGIRPTRPETGYGYIETGDVLAGKGVSRAVSCFIEKPGREKAQALIDAGNNLWNSGMFLFCAETVLRNFHRYALDILNAITQAKAEIVEGAGVCADTYAKVPEQPFDKAVMEKSDRIAVVPCSIGWSDIGSWESLWEITPKDASGNVVSGQGIAESCNNVMVRAGGDRLVACIGVEDIVVIDSGDAIVIMKKSASDGLKTVVSTLKKQDRAEVRKPASENLTPSNEFAPLKKQVKA